MYSTWATNIAGLVLWLGLIQPGQTLTAKSGLLPTYDYVIVGAGVSGLTVANRLSENNKFSILVIEAGGFDQDEDYILVPGLAGNAIGTKYDWNLTYVANPDLGNRTVSIPQGKAVGGSSLLNRMVFDRGSRADYDRWEALGNPGWGWRDLLPFFKKSERFTPPSNDIIDEWNVTYDPAVHGTTGHVQSSYAPWIWPSTKQFIRAITNLGVHVPRDGASGDALGGFFAPHSQDPVSVTRSDARRAYWDTASRRPNIHLVTGRRVTRLISENISRRVEITGVEFAAHRSAPRTIVNVRKEVLLAAGAIHTPQLLQLSGIGDPALLARHNISTVANVPGVGRNFQDHLHVPVVFSLDFPLAATNLTTNSTFAAESLALYRTEKTGPHADATGDFLAFLPAANFTSRTNVIHDKAANQDPRTYLDTDTPPTITRGYALQHKLLTAGIAAANEAQLEIIWADGTFVLGLQHPFSRGSVRLASSDPFAPPLTDPAYLRNPVDVRILTEAIKYARSLVQTPSLAAFNPVELVPGGNVTSDEDLEAYIRGAAESLFHPSGSCAVGKFQVGGVVDADFRVHGVKGLRVVDASVLPMLPATHIQSSVYAIAERLTTTFSLLNSAISPSLSPISDKISSVCSPSNGGGRRILGSAFEYFTGGEITWIGPHAGWAIVWTMPRACTVSARPDRPIRDTVRVRKETGVTSPFWLVEPCAQDPKELVVSAADEDVPVRCSEGLRRNLAITQANIQMLSFSLPSLSILLILRPLPQRRKDALHRIETRREIRNRNTDLHRRRIFTPCKMRQPELRFDHNIKTGPVAVGSWVYGREGGVVEIVLCEAVGEVVLDEDVRSFD
ncbi:hypothetical protein BDW66DRAFT_167410 [Aspergillus desertorum]